MNRLQNLSRDLLEKPNAPVAFHRQSLAEKLLAHFRRLRQRTGKPGPTRSDRLHTSD